nr:MAG TPA: hypothetical protein [Caudoviricetes sp.]
MVVLPLYGNSALPCIWWTYGSLIIPRLIHI